MTRQERVVALLRSRLDWLPAVPTATGRLGASRGADAGDSYVVDELVARRGPRPSVDVPAVVAREAARRRDAVLAGLERDEAARAGGRDARESFGWEAAKRDLWRAGSYAELERALAALRSVDEFGYAAVLVVYGEASECWSVGPELLAAADSALEELAAAMPAEIRVPSWLTVEEQAYAKKRAIWRGQGVWARAEREERDRRIRLSRRSAAEVAREEALSERRVRQIRAAGKDGRAA